MSIDNLKQIKLAKYDYESFLADAEGTGLAGSEDETGQQEITQEKFEAAMKLLESDSEFIALNRVFLGLWESYFNYLNTLYFNTDWTLLHDKTKNRPNITFG